MFAPLRVHGGSVLDLRRPSLDDLQRLLEARRPRVMSRSGMPLQFVAQSPRPDRFEERYEPRIYLRGAMQVDLATHHDIMNALVWLAFPRAKAALNDRHYHALSKQVAAGIPNRGPAQDALTLFDEGGVVAVSGDGTLMQMLRDFQWKDLFWRHRAQVNASMRFFLFGHALYEKSLRPFTGITGRGILFDVEAPFVQLPLAEQLDAIDCRLESCLLDESRLRTPLDLAPVPVLGVPGWWAHNENESYYDNTDYFRPGRRSPKSEKRVAG